KGVRGVTDGYRGLGIIGGKHFSQPCHLPVLFFLRFKLQVKGSLLHRMVASCKDKLAHAHIGFRLEVMPLQGPLQGEHTVAVFACPDGRVPVNFRHGIEFFYRRHAFHREEHDQRQEQGQQQGKNGHAESRPAENFSVEEFVSRKNGQIKAAVVFPNRRRSAAVKEHIQQGQEDKGHHQGDAQDRRHGHRLVVEKCPRRTAEEDQRDKNRQRGQYGTDQRRHHFVDTLHTGLEKGEAFPPFAGNVFHDDDGVVVQHAQAQRQPTQGDDIDGDMKQVKQQKAGQQGYRQADAHDEGDPVVAHEGKKYRKGEEAAEQQAGLEVADARVQQGGLVLAQVKIHLGVIYLELFHGIINPGQQLVHLGGALLMHSQHQAFAAVVQVVAKGFTRFVFYLRHPGKADSVTLAAGDGEPEDIFWIVHPGGHPEVVAVLP